MLSHFDRIQRVRATIILVVAYAFAILAPHAALAMSNGQATMHCLTEVMIAAHVHAKPAAAVEHVYAGGHSHAHHDAASQTTAQSAHHDGAKHDHGKAGNDNCCGLFCITALNHDGVAALPAPPPRALESATPATVRTSRDPDRIDEPPIG